MSSLSVSAVFAVLISGASVAVGQEAMTGTRPWTHAVRFGNTAGNDLANEIVVRINSGQNPELKKLIATDEQAAGLRQQCKDAIRRMLRKEGELLAWPAKGAGKNERRTIASVKDRDFTLRLGSGLEWKEKVTLVWTVTEVSLDNIKPPVRSMLWIQFALPTLPALGGGNMSIGGGALLRTEVMP